MFAKWTLNKESGYYLGLIVYDNKHYYASGRTVDLLEKNMKACMYNKEHIPTNEVHLEYEMSPSIDLSFANKIFYGMFCKPKPNKRTERERVRTIKMMEKQERRKYQKRKQEEEKEPEYIQEIDEKTNELVVYEIKEVKRYKLRHGILLPNLATEK